MTLYELVLKERISIGPTDTGGIIHLITDEVAAAVTTALYNAATATPPAGTMTPGAFVSLLFAWVRGESGFDPQAIDPNKDRAKPGETPQETFLHTDYGLGQYDGSELAGLFPDFEWEQQMARAYDITWAAPYMVYTVLNLLAWADAQYEAFRAHGVTCPVSANILAFEAYNAGHSGALGRALKALDGKGASLAVAGGNIILATDATVEQLALTAEFISDAVLKDGTYFLYGHTVQSRWVEYLGLVGVDPVPGTP
jgi:hypothetical protein